MTDTCSTILRCLLVLAFALPVPADADRPRKKRRLRHVDVIHKLTSSPGIHVRNEIRAWGTEKAVQIFAQAVEAVRTKHPRTPSLFVGDLSWRGGGRMSPHVSHRDGRDIDAGYYFLDGRQRKRFYKVTPVTLDAKRTWALFESMLETGEVEYIFVRHRLQRPLYEEALRSGWTKERLEPIFQYPRTAWNRQGIIRHVRGHDDHFHVRFRTGPLPAPMKATSTR